MIARGRSQTDMTDVDTVYLIHHSHTDIGYTHDQPVLWDLQRRFIETAIDLAERDADNDDLDAFRWTVESTAPLLAWLETASEQRVDQFCQLEQQGRIEVTAMLGNITPLYSPAQLVESLRPVRYLRDAFDIEVCHAMNADVNGQNWPLVDVLSDIGVETFTMGINTHFGGAPLDRPLVFRWEGPSGESIPALNGYHYSTGIKLGIGRDSNEFANEWWPRVERRLAEMGYPFSALPIPSYHPFGDNGPAFDGFTTFIREWNDLQRVQSGELPKIRMATLGDWWDAIDWRDHDLPVYRGDWTDFWNFGSGSSARELAMNRETKRRLRVADASEAALTGLNAHQEKRDPTRRGPPEARDEAWWDANFFDEHTWGSDNAVTAPESEDTHSQWNHKANYAYEARSLSQYLQRDSIAEIARRVESEGTE